MGLGRRAVDGSGDSIDSSPECRRDNRACSPLEFVISKSMSVQQNKGFTQIGELFFRSELLLLRKKLLPEFE